MEPDIHDRADDGVDRRGFLRCMGWAGTGIVWALSGGVPRSYAMNRVAELDESTKKSLFFAQISDSHIGFSKPANTDVTDTLRQAVAKLNALPQSPAFVLHTGDITHLSKPEEFDAADQLLKELKAGEVFFVPGEHDVLNDNGASYLARYGKRSKGKGWYSVDVAGVHFIGLVNVLDLKAGGLGSLGRDQLDWLARDVRGLKSSTPIVLFAHVPLWSVYPEWGWGTDDAAQALGLLKRFGSVTVLNGHIHQVMQKVEGQVSFHTAMSTAFPQPAPGTAASPGPVVVGAERLRDVLGITSVTYLEGRHHLAVVDATLSDAAVSAVSGQKADSAVVVGENEIAIDNFSFTPPVLTVPKGTRVTWTNRDDVPHQIASAANQFKASPVVDTNQRFVHTFDAPGTYPYFCTLHPKMTGQVVVK
jgi:3',5'-cyclic-AMP phosphodiesterase